MKTRHIFSCGFGIYAAIAVIVALAFVSCEQPTDTPVVTLTGITAVYSGTTTIYPDTSLDSLKTDLTVTAAYSDSTSKTVASADYTLSGSLTITATAPVRQSVTTPPAPQTAKPFPQLETYPLRSATPKAGLPKLPTSP